MTPERLKIGGENLYAVDSGEKPPSRAQDIKPQVIKGLKPLYAALDLGTNSCRMLIAAPKGDSFKVVDSFSRYIQLGAEIEESGRLSRRSMDRAVQALRICRSKLSQAGMPRMRLVATEACRRASNGHSFIKRVHRETGLKLEIISPVEEARLALISCAPLVDPTAKQVLIVDIGGGSTELVWIDVSEVPPQEHRKAILELYENFDAKSKSGAWVVDWISVPLGVTTLRERFRDVEPDKANFALMSCFFEESLASFTPYDMVQQPREGFQVIGTSGTVTTIAASHLGLQRYDRARVDGTALTSEQIDHVINTYLAMGPQGRKEDPCIGADRHDLVMSGAAILQTLLRLWPTDRLSVADRGLREGLLYLQMERDGVFAQRPARKGKKNE